MSKAMKVSIGVAVAFIACSVTPIIYVTSQLVLVTDKTAEADYNEIECTIEVMLEEFPEADVYLPMLHVIFQKDKVSSHNENNKTGYWGLYWCNSNRTGVWTREEGTCIAETSLIHESLHHLLQHREGDCDADHENQLYWEEFGPSSWESYLETLARERCCDE